MGTVTRPKEMVAVESERAATDAIIACVRQPPTPGRGSVFKSAEIMARLDCSVMDDRPSASDGQRAVERLPLVEDSHVDDVLGDGHVVPVPRDGWWWRRVRQGKEKLMVGKEMQSKLEVGDGRKDQGDIHRPGPRHVEDASGPPGLLDTSRRGDEYVSIEVLDHGV